MDRILRCRSKPGSLPSSTSSHFGVNCIEATAAGGPNKAAEGSVSRTVSRSTMANAMDESTSFLDEIQGLETIYDQPLAISTVRVRK